MKDSSMWYSASLFRYAEQHTSVMIGLDLLDEDAGRLVIDKDDLPPGADREGVQDLHITLCMLGKGADLAGQRENIEKALKIFAAAHKPLSGKVSGIGRFNGGDKDPLYASFDAPDLPAFRQDLVDMLAKHDIKIDETHGYSPHCTLLYLPKECDTPQLKRPNIVLKFNRITLYWGDRLDHFAL